jgi:hypothetical protein
MSLGKKTQATDFLGDAITNEQHIFESSFIIEGATEKIYNFFN